MAINYLGGKTKFAKYILSVILPGNEHRPYYEPFVGSAAFLVHVPGTMKRFANDKNPYMIAMHKAVRDGWIPPDSVTEEEYEAIKKSPNKYPPELVGFVSVGCSFGAQVFGTYARGEKGGKEGDERRAGGAKKAVLETAEALRGVIFSDGSFHQMNIPNGALVYCDPPYGNTTGYGPYTMNVGVSFGTWCNQLVERDCRVFISGYPHNKMEDWDVVWQREVKVNFSSQRTAESAWKNKRVECLFQHHSQSGIVRQPPKIEPKSVDMCPNCCSIYPEMFEAKCAESYHKWHDEAVRGTERNYA